MVSCSISSPALFIILNGELVFVAFVMRYPRALVYGQFPFLIVDLIVKVIAYFSGRARSLSVSVKYPSGWSNGKGSK